MGVGGGELNSERPGPLFGTCYNSNLVEAWRAENVRKGQARRIQGGERKKGGSTK